MWYLDKFLLRWCHVGWLEGSSLLLRGVVARRVRVFPPVFGCSEGWQLRVFSGVFGKGDGRRKFFLFFSLVCALSSVHFDFWQACVDGLVRATLFGMECVHPQVVIKEVFF